MKIFLLQIMWVSPEPHYRSKRYFATKKAALKAQRLANKSDLCIGTRVVEIEVEE